MDYGDEPLRAPPPESQTGTDDSLSPTHAAETNCPTLAGLRLSVRATVPLMAETNCSETLSDVSEKTSDRVLAGLL